MIYVIASPKGGVGKSTLAINLACWLTTKNQHVGESRGVLLIDADRQLSTHSWGFWRSGDAITPTVKYLKIADNDNIEELIPIYAENHDDIVIDVGGVENMIFLRVLTYAHKVFIPTTTAVFDYNSTSYMISMIYEKIVQFNPELHHTVIFWKIEPRSSEDKKCDSYRVDMMEQLHRSIPFAQTIVHNRTAFRESLLEGKCVFDYSESNPLYKKAQEELTMLFNEIVGGNV